MTVAVAWVRRINNCEELVFVSDSRLSGDGRIFDGCPKILTLPRSDCAICFAGYTGDAFPLMLQLSLAIDSHAPARRRTLELSALRKHALKVFNGMAEQIQVSNHVNTDEVDEPAATFLFGGYSWVTKEFKLWTISYFPSENRFAAHPSEWLSFSEGAGKVIYRKKQKIGDDDNMGRIAFAGDQGPLARELLLEKLNHTVISDKQYLDWQPFEVVRDMLRDPQHSETIGGAPQVTKVYQYMHCAPIGVFWPTKESGKVHLQGRACLGYERIDRWVLDPDTLLTEKQESADSLAEGTEIFEAD